MRYAIGLAISGSASFRTLAGIPARPVAFDVFSLHGSCLTNFGLTSFKVKSRLTLGVSTIGVKVCEKCLHKLPAMVAKNSLKLVADRLLVSFVTFDFLGRVWLSFFHFSFEHVIIGACLSTAVKNIFEPSEKPNCFHVAVCWYSTWIFQSIVI